MSLTGAAIGRVGEAMFSLYLYRPHLERLTGTRLGDFLPIYLRNGLLTGVAVAPSVLLMTVHVLVPERTRAFAQALAAIAVGVGSVAAGLPAHSTPAPARAASGVSPRPRVRPAQARHTAANTEKLRLPAFWLSVGRSPKGG